MVTRSQVLRTRSKPDVDAIVARLPAYKKPNKKTVFAAYYTPSSAVDTTFIVEVKQKAEEYYNTVKDADKVATFNNLLRSKYTISKRTGTHITKATKREVIPPPSNAAEIAVKLEHRMMYEFQDRDDITLIVAISEGSADYTVYIDSEGTNEVTLKDIIAAPSKRQKRSTSSSSTSDMQWMLPNRSGFAKWMYSKFGPDKYVNEDRSLFPQQRLVRDFMEFKSPYRGILLYHGLGVGKTCASIAAAEGFVRRHKKVFVLLPASLEQNYKNEILRCASIGNPHAKLWNLTSVPANKDHPEVKRIVEVYGVPYSKIKQYHKRLWLPYIADGIHYTRRGVSWDALSDADRNIINDFMMDYIEAKYTFISYNGIQTQGVNALGAHPFDDSFIVMDEAHNFISRVVNGSTIARRIFDLIMESKRSKMIFLTGTPIINHPYELCVLLNLVRGPSTIYAYKNHPDPTLATKQLADAGLMKYVDFVRVQPDKKKVVEVQLLPFNFVRTANDELTLKYDAWNDDENRMKDRIKQAFGVRDPPVAFETYALPSTKKEFNALFLDESDPDNPRVINEDMFMRRVLGLVSYFRTAGEEYFPTMLPRIVRNIPLSNYQFSSYLDVRAKERKMDMNSRKQRPGAAGLFSKKSKVYRAFSRMVCNFVFPEAINRPFPGELRSQLKREIANNEEDEDMRETPGDDEAINKRVQREYDTKLKKAMEELQKNEERYLEQTKLANAYSPKFSHVINDIVESPGSCLLYSQFRTIEGLGVLRLALQEAGFIEIEIEKHEGVWIIANVEEVLSSLYDGKRYVVFNEDREKTDLLIKIFNGAIDNLPSSISDSIRAAGYNSNLYGELARVIMISQSGAEGISLKNVRRVMITEPFWNKVRIDQVIGRAVRAGSHLALPADDRNVQVFMYMATFTPDQLRDNFTLQRLDKSQTSDEHIFDIAEHKSRIIDQYLTMIKRAAFDCATHAYPNKMLSGSGLQCYAFPFNMADDAFAYLPTLKDEKRELGKTKMERTHRIRGRVVSKNGKNYVKVDNIEGTFDYRAYKDAGVLMPADEAI